MRYQSALTASAAALALSASLPHTQEDAIRRIKSAGGGNADENAEEQASTAKAIKQLSADLVARDKEIADLVTKASDEATRAGQISDETKSALEALATKASDLVTRLTELEQKAVRSVGGGGGGQIKSLGEQFTESEEVALAIKGGQAWRGRARMELKAITSATTDANGSAGDLINPQRTPGIVAPPERTLTIRQLLAPGRTNSNSIEFVQETGYVNAAAMVAEGGLKPESTLKFNLETTNVRTLAHWVLASKQILDDVPQLQSYIDARMRYGLADVEEMQLLLGDGTGQNLLGLIPQATDFDEGRRKAGDTMIDTIRRAMTQVRIAEYRATGIVMHPSDWEQIELTKT